MTHHSRLGTSEAGTVYLSAVSPVPGVIQDSRATQALNLGGWIDPRVQRRLYRYVVQIGATRGHDLAPAKRIP